MPPIRDRPAGGTSTCTGRAVEGLVVYESAQTPSPLKTVSTSFHNAQYPPRLGVEGDAGLRVRERRCPWPQPAHTRRWGVLGACVGRRLWRWRWG